MTRPSMPGPPLAPGEAMLWQGTPQWRAVARRLFRVPLVGGYFAFLMAWRAASTAITGTLGARVAQTEAILLAGAVAAFGILLAVAWAVARTTQYTITTHGVVLRYGVGLPTVLVVPYRAVAHLGLRVHRDHTGDLALTLRPGQHIGYARLWPHARGWRFARPEPMLRAVAQGAVVGALLSRALAAAAPAPAEAVPHDGGQPLPAARAPALSA